MDYLWWLALGFAMTAWRLVGKGVALLIAAAAFWKIEDEFEQGP